MLIWRFRNRLWLVGAIVVADIVIGLWIGDKVVAWELEQIREAW